jgi:hypothetical protein
VGPRRRSARGLEIACAGIRRSAGGSSIEWESRSRAGTSRLAAVERLRRERAARDGSDDGRFHVDLHNSRSEESNSGVLYVSDPAEVFVTASRSNIGRGRLRRRRPGGQHRARARDRTRSAGLAIDDFAAVLERSSTTTTCPAGVRSLVGHDHARAGLLVPVE